VTTLLRHQEFANKRIYNLVTYHNTKDSEDKRCSIERNKIVHAAFNLSNSNNNNNYTNMSNISHTTLVEVNQ